MTVVINTVLVDDLLVIHVDVALDDDVVVAADGALSFFLPSSIPIISMCRDTKGIVKYVQ